MFLFLLLLQELGEPLKSITPPLAFRVSPRPTALSSFGRKQQLPRPIPSPLITYLPFITIPIDSEQYAVSSSSSLPPPPPLIASSYRGSNSGETPCSTPPPLLYIPAAAQRVTHLHGPPELKRFPPLSSAVGSELSDEESKSEATNELLGEDISEATEDPPLLTKCTSIGHEVSSGLRETSPPRLRRISSSETQEVLLSREEFLSQQRVSADSNDGSPLLTKLSTLDHRRLSLPEWKPAASGHKVWRSVSEQSLPNLKRCSSLPGISGCAGISDQSSLTRLSENPPILKRFPSVSDTEQSQNSVLLRSVKVKAPVRINRLEGSLLPSEVSCSNRTQIDHDPLLPIEVSCSARTLIDHDPLLPSEVSCSARTLTDHDPLLPSEVSCSGRTHIDHDPLARCRQEIAPPASDRTFFPSLKRSNYPSSRQVCESPAVQTSTVSGLSSLYSSEGVLLGPSALTGGGTIASCPSQRSASVLLDSQGFHPDKSVSLEKTPKQVLKAGPSFLKATEGSEVWSREPCFSDWSDRFPGSFERTCSSSNRNQSNPPRPALLLHQERSQNNASASFATKLAFPSARRAHVTSLYTGKTTTRVDVTSSYPNHVVPLVSDTSKRCQLPSQSGIDLRPQCTPSSNSSGEFRKLRLVSHAKDNPSNKLPPPWSHLEPSYSTSSRGTCSEPPKPYTLSFSKANSFTKLVFSSANPGPARIQQHCSTRESPTHPVSVIQTVDRRYRAAPEDLLRQVEEELAASSRGKRPANELQQRGRNNAVALSVSLPRAFQSPFLEEASSGLCSDLKTGGQMSLGDGDIRNRLDKICGHIALESVSLKVPDTNTGKAGGMNPPLKARRGRPPGRKNKTAENSVVSSKQANCRKNAVSDVSTSMTAFSVAKTPKGQLSEKESVNKTRAFGEDEALSRENARGSCSLVFHPSEEEFSDPISYIESIRGRAERFGLCVVAPPESWKVSSICFFVCLLFVRAHTH